MDQQPDRQTAAPLRQHPLLPGSEEGKPAAWGWEGDVILPLGTESRLSRVLPPSSWQA